MCWSLWRIKYRKDPFRAFILSVNTDANYSTYLGLIIQLHKGQPYGSRKHILILSKWCSNGHKGIFKAIWISHRTSFCKPFSLISLYFIIKMSLLLLRTLSATFKGHSDLDVCARDLRVYIRHTLRMAFRAERWIRKNVSQNHDVLTSPSELIRRNFKNKMMIH